MKDNQGHLLKDCGIGNTLFGGDTWLEDKLGCAGDHQEEGFV